MAKEETKAKDKEKKEELKETKDEKKEAKKEPKKEAKEEPKKEAKEEPKKEAKEEPKKQEAAAKAEEKKEWSKDIKELGDKIVSLTLMQAKDLGDYLKDEHGIEPAAGGAVMMAGPAGGEGEAEEEKTSFDVVLKEFGDKKIQVIKEVRALTGLGLKEAKGLVDAVPKPVKEGLSKEEADSAKEQLEAAGAVVELS